MNRGIIRTTIVIDVHGDHEWMQIFIKYFNVEVTNQSRFSVTTEISVQIMTEGGQDT